MVSSIKYRVSSIKYRVSRIKYENEKTILFDFGVNVYRCRL